MNPAPQQALSYDPRDLGARCDACPLKTCKPVPPETNANAQMALVGQMPGPHEVKRGRPYIGPAGNEITAALAALGVKRGDCHWTNVVACLAPGGELKRMVAQIDKRNTAKRKGWEKERRAAKKAGTEPPPLPTLDPTPIECCRPRLMAELEGFRDIVTLGTIPAKELLGRHANVMKVRGGMTPGHLRYDPVANSTFVLSAEEDEPPMPGFRSVRVLPVFEPAFVLRAKRWTKAFRIDLGRAVAWFQGRLTFNEPTTTYHPRPAALEAFLTRPGAVYSYDVETDNIECLSASMRCIAIGNCDEVVVVGLRDKDAPPLPVPASPAHGVAQTSLWYTTAELAQILQILRTWLADPSCVKIGHNAGYYDLLNCRTQLGVTPTPTLDTMMVHRLVESELPHNLGYVASIYAPAVKAWKADRDGRKLATEAESNEELHRYCALDVANTHRVLEPLMRAVEIRDQAKLIAKDHAVQRVCAELHQIGMFVNEPVRAEHEKKLVSEAVALRVKIREVADDPHFNPGSRDQLAALWFGKWKLNPPIDDDEVKFTMSGAPSTSDEVIRALLTLPKLPEEQKQCLLLTRKYRKKQKLLGTYVAKLRRADASVLGLGWDDDDAPEEREYRKRYNFDKKGITWGDGRVRPGYNAHVTNVGRLSSSRPWNAQNVPRWLRGMICAAPGHILVGADADQIHIRIYASLWRVKRYLEAFARGGDPHASTADACFPMTNRAGLRFRGMDGFPGGKWDGDWFIPDGSGDEWSGDAKKTRDLSKRVGFASAYQASVGTVHRVIRSAENKAGDLIYLGLTTPEVRVMHDAWLRGVPEVKRGWAHEERLYEVQGFLADPVDGRRKDFLDGAIPTETANYRVLATEAALMNRAMIAATTAIPWGRWGDSTGLLTQTHDSMVFEVPDDGVYEDNGTLRATPGTPAWETMHVLWAALNYDGDTVGLPGVRFTSVPTLGRTWASVG